MARGDETLIFGDGLQTRDFVYVGDVVDSLLAAVGRDGGVFNIGTGNETSVLALHEACRAVSGREDEARFEPARLGDARRSVLDVSLAAHELELARPSAARPGLAADLGVVGFDRVKNG